MEEKVLKEVGIPDIPSNAESTLKTIAMVILICGIIVSIILLFTIVFVGVSGTYYSEKEFNPSGFAMTIGILLSSIASWASLNVFANISLRLKAIQETMPLRLIDENEIKQKDQCKQEENITPRKSLSDIKVGDRVTWRKSMTKYTVEDIAPGKVLLSTGLLGGKKWIPEEEIIIPQ